MKFFHRAAPRRLVFERLFKTAVLSCVERLFYCGKCPFVRRAEKINEAQIEDQSGILAQNFFVVRKTSAGFFRDPLFRTIPNPVSSAHFLTAAKTVHTNARGAPLSLGVRGKVGNLIFKKLIATPEIR
jgi:hypothetical protein